MAKKQFLLADAERLYVQEQLTLEEIAGRMDVSVRSLQTWKTEHEWDRKRANFLNSRMNLHAELQDFTLKLMRNIRDDLDTGKELQAARLHTLARLLPFIPKLKEYEDDIAKTQADDKPSDLNTDDIVAIVRAALGVAPGTEK